MNNKKGRLISEASVKLVISVLVLVMLIGLLIAVYYIFVAENDDGVIGSLSLYVQNKFIHNGSCVGSIEEVVIRKKFRGKNIGSLLVDQAVKRCEELGCYKVLLYCYDDVVPFYERNGFEVFKQNLMGKTLGK